MTLNVYDIFVEKLLNTFRVVIERRIVLYCRRNDNIFVSSYKGFQIYVETGKTEQTRIRVYTLYFGREGMIVMIV